jgi:hypothetical protein
MTDAGTVLETFAIGFKKDCPPEFLSGVKWGFMIDKKGVVRMNNPKEPAFLPTATPELSAAIYRWNTSAFYADPERITEIKYVTIPKKGE